MSAEEGQAKSRSRWAFFTRHRKIFIGGFYILLLVFCVESIRAALRENDLRQFAASLSTLGPTIVILAALCVVGTYAMMCFIEQLVLRDVAARPPPAATIAAPLIANSVSIGLGFGALSGAAIRVRIYSRSGVDAQTCVLIASGVTLVSLSGGAVLALLGLTFEPGPIAARLGAHADFLRAIGVLGLSLVVGALALAAGKRNHLSVLGRRIRIPGGRTGLMRLAAGLIDWMLSATVLFLLLPDQAQNNWLAFAAMFASLHFIAMSTGAPAGIGVFDAAMIGLNPTDASSGQLAAALVVYRLLSFLSPLVLGLIGLLFLEGHREFGVHHAVAGATPSGPMGRAFQRFTRHAVHFGTRYWSKPLSATRGAPPSRTSAARVGALLRSGGGARPTSLRRLTRGAPIMVMAPHPDDEILGCGGLLAACAAAGVPAYVVILTNGALSHPGSASWSQRRLAARRAQEAVKATRRLGLPARALTQLKLRDGQLLLDRAEMRAGAAAIARLARRRQVKTLIVSWRHDPHPDHVAAALMADAVHAQLPYLRLLEYPIWSWLLPASVSVVDGPWKALRLDVSAWLNTKRRALLSYRTQTTALIADAPIALRLQRDQLDALLTRSEVYFYRDR
jgi:LmbE family N-acetylglucosaminyl deacetylase/uncharacterized membrane protein YbhN (UPF0104 family)